MKRGTRHKALKPQTSPTFFDTRSAARHTAANDRYRVLFRVALEPGTRALQLGYRAGASLRLSLLRPTVPRWREDGTEHARALQPIGAGLQLGISCPKY